MPPCRLHDAHVPTPDTVVCRQCGARGVRSVTPGKTEIPAKIEYIWGDPPAT